MLSIQGGTGCVRGDEKKKNECGMEMFGALDRGNAIAVLGDRWWPQKAKQERDKVIEKFLCNI